MEINQTNMTIIALIVCFCCVRSIISDQTEEKETEKFTCKYHESTLSLDIEYGVTNEQITECMKAHNTAVLLKLRNSHLNGVPKYLDILDNLEYLDLSHNQIANVTFYGIEQVCQRLRRLSLDHNEIHEIRIGDLDCLQSLEYLNIGDNNLSIVENGTFSKNISNINYIHLVNNSITVFDLSFLNKLKLTDNTSIMINASHNWIATFTNSANITIENFTKRSKVGLVLTHNNLTTIDLNYLLNLLNVTNPFQLLRLWNSGFDVRFNPFICDCVIFPFAQALRKYHFMDPDNPVFSVTCFAPKSLSGMLMRKVPPNQFNCSVDENCPKGCTCIKTAALDLVTVHCDEQYQDNDLPKACPSAEEIIINIKSSKLTKVSTRAYLHNVSLFDLSRCEIANLDASLVGTFSESSTKRILFNDNKLTTIPKSFEKFNFSNGQILTLDGNPFTCDCHTLWMKRWLLSHKEHILRLDNIICATGSGKNKPIIEVPDNMFICQSLTFIDKLSIVFASISAFALIVSITACKFKSIQVYMISHFDLCKFCCRRRKHRCLLYDIFIPHSCEDDDVIETIIHKLEHHNPPYRVCIGEKNFKPGKTISENILDAIESSHTTLLVISNNFLKSTWCNVEFREAHMRFLTDRNINMVIIVLEDLDTKHICKELKLHMDTHVYIKYKDKHFWAKLLQSLPIMIQTSTTENSPLLSS